jgi:hypothetical protein
MDRLRRLARHLALPLVLLLPGLGGTWLQAAHPCPVEQGAVGHAGHGGPSADLAGHGGHAAPHQGPDDGAPAQDAEHATCTCVGACGQGAAPAAPVATTSLQDAVHAFTPIRPTIPAWLPVFAPTDFLPLSTAPPHA